MTSFFFRSTDRTISFLVFLLIFAAFTPTIGFSQENKTVLSQTEMYADIDSLISIIENANPHLGIYRQAMNHDVIEILKTKRAKLDELENISAFDFYRHLFSSIKTIPEIHCRPIRSRESIYWKEQYPQFFLDGNVEKMKKLENEIKNTSNNEDSIFNAHNRGYYTLPVKYINGNYTVTRPVNIIQQDVDTIKLKAGMILKEINNTSVHSFFQENRDDYILFRIRWDAINKRFFCDDILSPYSYIVSLLPVTLNLFSPESGEEIVVQFPANNTKRYINAKHVLGEPDHKELKPKVTFFDNILFIKVPAMSPDDIEFYRKEIPATAHGKTVKKVVVDIRGNYGGSDYVWENILSMLTDTVLCRHADMGVKQNSIFDSYSISGSQFKDIKDTLPVYYDAMLHDNYILLSEDDYCQQILPDEESINFKGKIYLLHDRNSFSAANSFVTFAIGSDKVVAVGEPTGFLSGYGIDPFIFQLPNSKLCFIMHSVIHFPQDRTEIDNYLWNETEIPVTPTVLFENIMAEYGDWDIYDRDFLYKYDIYFQEALRNEYF